MNRLRRRWLYGSITNFIKKLPGLPRDHQSQPMNVILQLFLLLSTQTSHMMTIQSSFYIKSVQITIFQYWKLDSKKNKYINIESDKLVNVTPLLNFTSVHSSPLRPAEPGKCDWNTRDGCLKLSLTLLVDLVVSNLSTLSQEWSI